METDADRYEVKERREAAPHRFQEQSLLWLTSETLPKQTGTRQMKKARGETDVGGSRGLKRGVETRGNRKRRKVIGQVDKRSDV